jgi:hypothetical protein
MIKKILCEDNKILINNYKFDKIIYLSAKINFIHEWKLFHIFVILTAVTTLVVALIDNENNTNICK